MDQETIHDIHNRLHTIEQDVKQVLAHTEHLSWLKWHIRALWAAMLGLLGIKTLQG
jgi:hypothetical protein